MKTAKKHRPGWAGTLSSQMREILLLANTRGRISIREVIRRRISEGAKPGVAKASLSRTLRRLWLLGLIDLHELGSGYRFCATEKRLNAQRILEETRQDPQVAYQGYVQWAKAFAAMVGRPSAFKDAYGNAEAFLAAKERAFAECPAIRARYIEATAQGLQAVNSLDEKKVNRTRKKRRHDSIENGQGNEG
jgi:hypothetical protein